MTRYHATVALPRPAHSNVTHANCATAEMGLGFAHPPISLHVQVPGHSGEMLSRNGKGVGRIMQEFFNECFVPKPSISCS